MFQRIIQLPDLTIYKSRATIYPMSYAVYTLIIKANLQ